MNSSRIPIALCVLSLAVSTVAWGQTKPAPTDEVRAKVYGQFWRTMVVNGSIPQLLATTTGDIVLTSHDDEQANDMGVDEHAPYPPVRLVGFSCLSDAVVVATAVHGDSHLTEAGGFIYSEWVFRIKEVLQDNPKAPIALAKTTATPLIGTAITVARGGGTLIINGRKVTGIEHNFPEFQPSADYLLFLTYVPQTGAYRANGGRAFNLSLDEVPEKTQPYMDHDQRVPAKSEDVLRDTRAAITDAAGHCKRGGNQ
jgi:hypothetical protein